jgi:hypothetical protein
MSQDLTLPNAADFCPDVESLAPGSSELGGSDMIPTDIKQVVDLIVGRQKALRLADRFELLHLPLSSFSARLFSPLCRRCSTLGMTSRLAAP